MITLQDAAKRFERSWIFKNIHYTFLPGQRYAIVGNNGSGKSTLLRCIANIHDLNKGSISYASNKNAPLKKEIIYKHLAYCAPGMDIIEEMTLEEFLLFHFQFKPLVPQTSIADLIRSIHLTEHKNTLLKNFSSGMRQRVKLAQVFYSDVPILLLDEPCTNLDQMGFELYEQLLNNATAQQDKIVIIASNDEREYPNTTNLLYMADYKK